MTDLTKRDFEWVYAQELSNGKFWGIEHDIRVVRGEGLAVSGEPPFVARFDYAYATSASLRLHGVQPPLAAEQMAALLEGRAQVSSVATMEHGPCTCEARAVWQPASRRASASMPCVCALLTLRACSTHTAAESGAPPHGSYRTSGTRQITCRSPSPSSGCPGRPPLIEAGGWVGCKWPPARHSAWRLALASRGCVPSRRTPRTDDPKSARNDHQW